MFKNFLKNEHGFSSLAFGLVILSSVAAVASTYQMLRINTGAEKTDRAVAERHVFKEQVSDILMQNCTGALRNQMRLASELNLNRPDGSGVKVYGSKTKISPTSKDTVTKISIQGSSAPGSDGISAGQLLINYETSEKDANGMVGFARKAQLNYPIKVWVNEKDQIKKCLVSSPINPKAVVAERCNSKELADQNFLYTESENGAVYECHTPQEIAWLDGEPNQGCDMNNDGCISFADTLEYDLDKNGTIERSELMTLLDGNEDGVLDAMDSPKTIHCINYALTRDSSYEIESCKEAVSAL